MNKSEIKKAAKDILLFAWYDLQEHPATNCTITENEDSEIEFHMKFDEGYLGRSKIVYTPQPFIESLIEEADVLGEEAKKSSTEAEQELIKWELEKRIHTIAGLIVSHSCWSFHATSLEQGLIAMCIYDEAYKSATVRVVIDELRHPDKKFHELLISRKRTLDFFLERTIKGYAAPMVLFCLFYELQWEKWKKAKKFYTKIKNQSRKPVDLVIAEFEDLPADLIEKMVRFRDYDAEPRKLALLCAARIAHLPLPHNVNTLQSRLDESKKMRSEMSEDAFNETLEYYIEFLKQELEIAPVIENLLTTIDQGSNNN